MASSEILAKIGLNSAGFKTGLAQCKLAANSFKSSVGGMFKNLGGQVLGMLGVSAGIAGLGALAKQTIALGGHVEDEKFAYGQKRISDACLHRQTCRHGRKPPCNDNEQPELAND